MNINSVRDDLSIKGKNGIAFLCSGIIIWIIISLIFSLSIGVNVKNILMLFSTGLMFPLSIGLSQMFKADWKLEGNPLSKLGLYLNLAQIMYFPILFWAIIKTPESAVIFFAIITSAHFFPYGWYYRTRSYEMMAPIMGIIIFLMGWNLEVDRLLFIPITMAVFLIVLMLWAWIDYRRTKV